MSLAKAAVSRHTDPALDARQDCPMLDAPTQARLEACVQESKEFSRAVLAFLAKRPRGSQAAWVAASVDAGKVVFQPWAMEILFVLAVAGNTRFTELQTLLGISSRTLSDKLQSLRQAGLIDRTVYDEQPVRIEYALTRQGIATAALATPLFAQLNNDLARASPAPVDVSA